MANIAEALVRFTGDASGAVTASQEVAASLGEVDAAAKKTNTSLDDNAQASQRAATAEKEHGDQSRATATDMGVLRDTLNQVAEAKRRDTEATTEHTQSEHADRQEAEQTEGTLHRLVSGFLGLFQVKQQDTAATREHTGATSELRAAFEDARAKTAEVRAEFSKFHAAGSDVDAMLAKLTQEAFTTGPAFNIVRDSLANTHLAGSELDNVAKRLTASIGTDLAKASSDGARGLKETEDVTSRLPGWMNKVDDAIRPLGGLLTFLGASGHSNAGGMRDTTSAIDGVVGGLGTFTPALAHGQQALTYFQLASQMLIPALIALVVAFLPLISAIVAFTVALAGALLVMAVGLGAPIAMAAAFTMLGKSAAGATGPLNDFKNTWTGVYHDLQSGAVPILAQVLQFLDSFAPVIEQMGLGVERWLRGVLPQVLQMLQPMIMALLQALQQLGHIFAGVTQYVLQNKEAFQTLWNDALKVVVSAIGGIMTNLVHLSDWFFKNLPAFEPVMKAVFGFIGSTIQIAARIIGGLGLAFANFFSGIGGQAGATEPLVKAMESLGISADHARRIIHEVMSVVRLLGTIIKGVVETVVDFGKHFAATFAPSYHGLADTLDRVSQKLGPFFQILRQVASEIGTIAGHIVSADLFGLFEKMLPPMIAVGTFILHTLNPALKFLADHSYILYPIVVAIGVAFASWKIIETVTGMVQKIGGAVTLAKDSYQAFRLAVDNSKDAELALESVQVRSEGTAKVIQGLSGMSKLAGQAKDAFWLLKWQMDGTISSQDALNLAQDQGKLSQLAARTGALLTAAARQVQSFFTGEAAVATDGLAASEVAAEAPLWPLLIVIGLVVAVIAGLVIGIIELVKHWKQVKEAAEAFWNAIKPIRDFIANVFIAVWHDLVKAFDYVKENWKAFVAIFLILNPEILAIIKLIQFLKAHWDQIVDVFKAVGHAIESFLRPPLQFVNEHVIQPIAHVLGAVLTPALHAVEKAFHSTGEGISKAWDPVKRLFEWIGHFIDGIVKFFDHLYDVLIGKSIIPDLVHGIVHWFSQLWDDITGPIREGIKKVVDFFKDLPKEIGKVLTDLKEFVKHHWQEILLVLIPTAGVIAEIFKHWGAIKKGIGDIVTGIKDHAKQTFGSMFSDLGSAVHSGWEGLKGFWSNGTGDLKKLTDDFHTQHKQGWTHHFTDLGQEIQKGWDKVKKPFEDAFKFIEHLVRNFWPLIMMAIPGLQLLALVILVIQHWDKVKKLFEEAHQFITNLTKAFHEWIRNAWHDLTDWLYNTLIAPWWDRLKNLWHDAHQFIQNLVTNFKEWIQNAWHDFTSWIENLLHDWWQRVRQGFWDFLEGIKSFVSTHVDDIVNFFRDLPGRVVNALKNLAGDIGTLFHDAMKAAVSPINTFVHGLNGLLSKVNLALPDPLISLAAGGVIPSFAAGGSVPAREVGAGFVASSPTLVVRALVGEGEGSGAGPEYVIPTASAYRSNALRLWGEVGSKIGAFAEGGEIGTIMDIGLSAVQKLAAGGQVGSHGGQCVVYVENVEGIHFNVDYASEMASMVNSQEPKVGNIFVSTIPPYGHTGIVNGPNSVIDSNWGLDELIQIHPLSSIPDIVGYIDLGKGLPAGVQTGSSPGGIKGIALAAIQKLEAPLTSAVQGLDQKFGIAGQMVQGVVSMAAQGVESVFGLQATGTSSSKTAVSGEVKDWINQAIKLTGVDPSWAAALQTIASHESGGDPNVDQGGLTGYAQAHGLMQMIQATFAQYMLPGHTNIYDPVANAAAAIEYIKARYGNPNNTPGIRSLNTGGSYQGYATGGIALTPQLAALAENGPEAVLPLGAAMRGGELSDQTDLLQQAVDILKQIAAPNPRVPSSFSARMRHA